MRKFIGLVLGLGSCVLMCSCHPKKTQAKPSGLMGGQTEGVGVGMALRSLNAQNYPQMTFAEFMGIGALSAPQISVAGVLPARVLETFSSTLRVEVYPLNTGALRREVISVNTLAANRTIVDGSVSLSLSPQLRVGSQIEIVRNFQNASQAAHAVPFNPMQLPFGANNALSLPEGTYVGIPIEGTVAVDVDGNFLSAAGKWESQLWDLLRSGAAGVLSGSVQGSLLASGRWRLQVLKLAGSQVRVRVVEDDSSSLSGSATVAAGGQAGFVYVPKGVVARALDITQRVVLDARMADAAISMAINDAENRITGANLVLPEPVRRARDLARVLPVFNDESAQRLDNGLRVADNAVNLARQGSDALRNIIDTSVLASYKQVRADLLQKVDVLDQVQQRFKHLTQFTYDVGASLRLSADFAKQHRFVADYVFDLSTDEGKLAYEHAVSGRSVWLGPVPPQFNADAGFSNFSVAERLAAEDSFSQKPRVIRNLLGESSQKSRSLGVTFSGLFSSTGFSESWKNNEVWARDASGVSESWRAALWQFDRRLNMFQAADSENLSSGVLLPGAQASPAQHLGTYWFNVKRQVSGANSIGMQSVFADTMNILGPFGVAYNIPRYYKGEFPGNKFSSLLVVFADKGMDAFFDASRVNDALLWKALGNVANTFDNTFGLPFNTMGDLPGEAAGTPDAVAACDIVRRAWGGAYCDQFANDFLKRMSIARNSNDLSVRMNVFESFYSRGFLANKIGARLLVRYVLEVLTLAYGKDAESMVSVQFNVQNAQNASALASPSFSTGTSDELQILQSLGMMQ